MVIQVRRAPETEPEYTATVPAAAVKRAEKATRDAEDALLVAQSFPIESAEDYEAACEELKKAKAGWAELEADRVSFTGPLNAVVKAINDRYRAGLDLWKRVENSIKERAKPYLQRIERERLAEEARRQAELRKLAEREERAAEKGQESKVAELQGKAAVLASAPSAVEAPQVSGVSSRVKWTYEVINEALIPREYLVIDHAKIGREVRGSGDKIQIPGVKVLKDLTIASRRG